MSSPTNNRLKESYIDEFLGELQLAVNVCIDNSRLTQREESVIRLRFGLDDPNGVGKTLDEVGRMRKVTRERVRQIEGSALRKLRDNEYFVENFAHYLRHIAALSLVRAVVLGKAGESNGKESSEA